MLYAVSLFLYSYYSTACYPNGTIRFPNPDPAVYVDAMAIQDQGSQQATKCLVDPRGPYIVITGCSAVSIFILVEVSAWPSGKC